MGQFPPEQFSVTVLAKPQANLSAALHTEQLCCFLNCLDMRSCVWNQQDHVKNNYKLFSYLVSVLLRTYLEINYGNTQFLY